MNPVQFIKEVTARMEDPSLVLLGFRKLHVPDVLSRALRASQEARIACSPVMIKRSQWAMPVTRLLRSHVSGNIPLPIPLAPKQCSPLLVFQKPRGGLLNRVSELSESNRVSLLRQGLHVRVVLRGQNNIQRRQRFRGTLGRSGWNQRSRKRARHSAIEQPVHLRRRTCIETTVGWHIQPADQHRGAIVSQPYPSAFS